MMLWVLEHIDDENTIVSIYISNSMLWMDMLDLWESFDDRIATIYLPDRKRPMMPTNFLMIFVVCLKNKNVLHLH